MTFSVSGGLDELGPHVEVQIDVPTRLRRKRPSEFNVSPINLKLLVDTGAAFTSIPEDAMRWLRLSSHDRSAVRTVTVAEPHPVDVWEINLILDARNVFENLRVFGCARMGTCDGLLGRDLLRHGSFRFEGMRKHWSLRLEPPKKILG